MKRTSILMTLTVLLVVAAGGGVGFGSPGGPAPPPEKLVVHEWGTFLSVQGSDGTTLGGMQKLGVPQPRIDHLLKQNDPALLAQVVKELEVRA